MKKAIIVILVILTILGCSEEESVEVIYDFKISPLGENDVKVDWTENETGNIVKFTIYTDNQFDTPVVETETESSENTITLSGLAPMTNYFLKIEVLKDGGIIWSEIKDFTSSYTSEIVNYPSTDGVEICAIRQYISTKLSPSSKKVIFMHEAYSTKSVWNATGIIDSLIKAGHLCVAFDFRGWGGSNYSGNAYRVFIDEPWLLREDFDATINYLDTIDLDCSDEIIVFGSSMGACVATVVSSYDYVKGGVVASVLEPYTIRMMEDQITPKGMYYIAGKLDDVLGVDYVLSANNLYNRTLEPRKIEILLGSPSHGVNLFEVDKQLVIEAIDWVNKL